MTATFRLPSATRVNVWGAYQVRVQLKAGQWFLDDDRVTVTPPADGSRPDWVVNWGSTHGSVTPDGSLSVEPEPWVKRHYRRAVMQGAGVYRWGLWAMLAPGRPAAEPDAQAGAALGCVVRFLYSLWAALMGLVLGVSVEPKNGAAQLAGFIRESRSELTPSRLWRCNEVVQDIRASWQLNSIEEPDYSEKGRLFRRSILRPKGNWLEYYAEYIDYYFSPYPRGWRSSYRDFLNRLTLCAFFANGKKLVIKRGGPCDAVILKYLRFLGRVLAELDRLKWPDLESRPLIPPLHAQPRPPAAPLAPPAAL